jgi:hypothetical protein
MPIHSTTRSRAPPSLRANLGTRMIARRRSLSAAFLALAALSFGCTLLHPLDGYGDGYVDAANDAPVPADGGNEGPAPCVGVPMILEPTEGQSVGASIHLRVSAPPCIDDLIAYIDSKEVAQVSTNAIDQWVTVASGSHSLNVNGWAGTPIAHPSDFVKFSRP